MAIVTTDPRADINGIHLVHRDDVVTSKIDPRGVQLRDRACAVTYPWLQEAFKRCPLEEGETVFTWASRVEKHKVITFSQAYLLRQSYATYFFAYVKDAEHIN